MDLREGERILRVYRHHPTPFIFDVCKTIGGALPFFFLILIIRDSLSPMAFFIGNLLILFVFVLVVIYLALIYWLDKLVVTNLRVIYIDWKFLTNRDESEAFLDDVQDVQTHEMGVLSYFKFFDYGTFSLETASSHVTLVFKDAPNPEGIRKYIYHIRRQ